MRYSSLFWLNNYLTLMKKSSVKSPASTWENFREVDLIRLDSDAAVEGVLAGGAADLQVKQHRVKWRAVQTVPEGTEDSPHKTKLSSVNIYLWSGSGPSRTIPGLQQSFQRGEAVLQLLRDGGEHGGTCCAAACQVFLLHVVQQYKVPKHRAYPKPPWRNEQRVK